MKSGFATAVLLAGPIASPSVLACERVELCDPKLAATRQPFHAGMGEAQRDADAIARLSTIIQRCARQSISELLSDRRLRGRRLRGACLVVGSVIDPATVANPHIRAHASEGRLFRMVLADALQDNGVDCAVVVEKQLLAHAVRKLGRSEADVMRTVASLGRGISGRWRAEEKAAAIAAWVALV